MYFTDLWDTEVAEAATHIPVLGAGFVLQYKAPLTLIIQTAHLKVYLDISMYCSLVFSTVLSYFSYKTAGEYKTENNIFSAAFMFSIMPV